LYILKCLSSSFKNMPATSATAPGKAILFGEHAVVYNRPAIAVPVTEIQAKAYIKALPQFSGLEHIFIDAPDIQLSVLFSDLQPDHPIAALIMAVKKHLNINRLPPFHIKLVSNIPIASGLGSGAAISIAAAKAICTFLGHPLPPEEISAIAYEVEKIHHGNPSGIDNAVIAHAKPVFFIRNTPLEVINIKRPFSLVIADSGIASLTREAVGKVRQSWQNNPSLYETWFDEIAILSSRAREILTSGDPQDIGSLMVKNQQLLQKIGVSTPELDRLVEISLQSGAWGAKLSGAGCGGNMIAIAPTDKITIICDTLKNAGATHTVVSHLKPGLGNS
ncbi:MAG: mevalonate kinase, partial [Anaerolineae bacterium]|nr:mevalonate kinase [Anaerolineae bacterium]